MMVNLSRRVVLLVDEEDAVEAAAITTMVEEVAVVAVAEEGAGVSPIPDEVVEMERLLALHRHPGSPTGMCQRTCQAPPA